MESEREQEARSESPSKTETDGERDRKKGSVKQAQETAGKKENIQSAEALGHVSGTSQQYAIPVFF